MTVIFLFTDVLSKIPLIVLLIGLLVLFIEFRRFALSSAIVNNKGITYDKYLVYRPILGAHLASSL